MIRLFVWWNWHVRPSWFWIPVGILGVVLLTVDRCPVGIGGGLIGAALGSLGWRADRHWRRQRDAEAFVTCLRADIAAEEADAADTVEEITARYWERDAL